VKNIDTVNYETELNYTVERNTKKISDKVENFINLNRKSNKNKISFQEIKICLVCLNKSNLY